MSDETEKKQRARSVIDIDNKKLTMIGEDGAATLYDLAALPANTTTYAIGRGVALRLGSVTDQSAEWAKLMAGTLPTERAAGVQAPSLTDQAIALAMRDELATAREIKKNDKTAYAGLLDEATAMVAKLEKAKKLTYRTDRRVIVYTASLKATAAPQMSLLEAGS